MISEHNFQQLTALRNAARDGKLGVTLARLASNHMMVAILAHISEDETCWPVGLMSQQSQIVDPNGKLADAVKAQYNELLKKLCNVNDHPAWLGVDVNRRVHVRFGKQMPSPLLPSAFILPWDDPFSIFLPPN